jgi:hypothetical protein
MISFALGRRFASRTIFYVSLPRPPHSSDPPSRTITRCRLTAEQIDEGKLIDQHYYAIASKATILKPEQLNVPADKFKAGKECVSLLCSLVCKALVGARWSVGWGKWQPAVLANSCIDTNEGGGP